MKSIKDIKNIFYINLDYRLDRKSYFEAEIKKLPLATIPDRFNAIKHTCGAVGCSMSHLALLKYAKEQNLDHILIMEDDIMFLNPDTFVNSLNKFLSSNIDFDVLLIAGNNMGEYSKINDFSVKITKCQTTTGYLVKKPYYDKLITNIEEGINNLLVNLNKLNDYAIDQYWSSLQKKDNWYLLTPLTITQRPDYSNIEKRITNYNRVMLDLDKKGLRQVKLIKERVILSNVMNNIINHNL
jgi:GR25 family glycosyltransferase involved in LPS biosynthesis